MKKFDTKSMVLIALLTGILIVMTMTPIGYLNIGPLSITLQMIPVALGAIALGPAGGAFLGFVFGMTSFVRLFTVSNFLSLVMVPEPALAAVVCIVPRTLMGLIVGLVFKAISAGVKTEEKIYKFYPLMGTLAAACNTLLFMSFFLTIFSHSDTMMDKRGGAGILAFAVTLVGVNAIYEIIAATVITGAIAVALRKARLIKPLAA